MISLVNNGRTTIMLWYKDHKLQSKIVKKRYMEGEVNKDGTFTDIYTKNKMKLKIKEGLSSELKYPIPYPLYEYYDYSLATKLLEFKDIDPDMPRAVFFDIETTSLNPLDGVITSIAWLDNYTGEMFSSINKGDEKDAIKPFIDYILKNKILSLIGFNSSKFDIPYLEERCRLQRIRFPKERLINQDVMSIANKLFISGSLDSIAEQLGVERKLEVDNPVTLWKEGKYDILLEYNIQDVQVTKQIYDKLDISNFMKALWNLTWFDFNKVHANSHIANTFFNKRMFEDKLMVSKADLIYKDDFGGGANFDPETGKFD